MTGSATITLFKGKASIASRASPLSLYNPKVASMDEAGGWEPGHATGFIRINSTRLISHSRREKAIKAGEIKA